MVISIYRSSLEDILIIYNLLKEYNIKIPFNELFEKDYQFITSGDFKPKDPSVDFKPKDPSGYFRPKDLS